MGSTRPPPQNPPPSPPLPGHPPPAPLLLLGSPRGFDGQGGRALRRGGLRGPQLHGVAWGHGLECLEGGELHRAGKRHMRERGSEWDTHRERGRGCSQCPQSSFPTHPWKHQLPPYSLNLPCSFFSPLGPTLISSPQSTPNLHPTALTLLPGWGRLSPPTPPLLSQHCPLSPPWCPPQNPHPKTPPSQSCPPQSTPLCPGT